MQIPQINPNKEIIYPELSYKPCGLFFKFHKKLERFRKLVLGQWQNIVFINFDNRPRTREILVKVWGK